MEKTKKIMKIQSVNTHPFEIEELACKILGLDYEEIDADELIIDQKMIDDIGIDLVQFKKIIDRLLPLIMVADGPLTEKKYKGFADIGNSTWLTKIEII